MYFDDQTFFIELNDFSKSFLLIPKFNNFSFNFFVSEFSINFICKVFSLHLSNNFFISSFFNEEFIFEIFSFKISLISLFSGRFKKYSFTLKGIAKLSGYFIKSQSGIFLYIFKVLFDLPQQIYY